MRIDLSLLDHQEDFHVDLRHLPDLGDLVLVAPSKTKFRWLPHELALRSLLVRPDGTIVSSGWPKFYNFSENPAHDAITNQALADGRVAFTTKEDGSLVIRSVIAGRAHFRTRGSHELGVFHEPVMRLVARYPVLLDPTYRPEGSVLFEFCSDDPAQQVVVRHAEARLVVLGYVHHPVQEDGLPRVLASRETTTTLSKEIGAPCVDFHELPADAAAVVATVKKWDGREGVVAWCVLEDGTTHLTKFKSFWYLALHALKSKISDRRFRQFCFLRDIVDEAGLRAALGDLGLDWEAIEWIRGRFDAYLARREELLKAFAAMDEAMQGVSQNTDRKTLALALQRIAKELGDPTLFHYAIQKATGRVVEAQAMVGARILDMPIQAFRLFMETAPKNAAEVLVDLTEDDDA